MDKNKLIKQRFKESILVKEQIIQNEALVEIIIQVVDNMVEAINRGNKLLICGNGGSASDALHFAGEIVGRFQKERDAWPAIALNSDVSTMTAIANDYSYNDIFARQTKAHAKPNDIFIGISTSGNSENVFRAAKIAKEKGAITVALLGKDGGKLKNAVDYSIVVECNTTARVQESHICIIHIICELVEQLAT